MTYIQPNKNKNIANVIVALLIVAIGAGVFGMIALYNATVNLNQNIAAAKTELDSVGAGETKLQNQIVASFGGDALSSVVAGQGLVDERSPEYFEIGQPAAGGGLASAQ